MDSFLFFPWYNLWPTWTLSRDVIEFQLRKEPAASRPICCVAFFFISLFRFKAITICNNNHVASSCSPATLYSKAGQQISIPDRSDWSSQIAPPILSLFFFHSSFFLFLAVLVFLLSLLFYLLFITYCLYINVELLWLHTVLNIVSTEMRFFSKVLVCLKEAI